MHYVYVLKSQIKERIYIGETADLKNRLERHNLGKVKSTKSYKPWKLIYYEAYSEKRLGKITERFYKTSQGKRQIKKKLEI
jgi:putative endonuclease